MAEEYDLRSNRERIESRTLASRSASSFNLLAATGKELKESMINAMIVIKRETVICSNWERIESERCLETA
jgi:hypothetical protein